MSAPIIFRLNDEVRHLAPGTSPFMTLLDWLRGPAGLRGTKEGCAEGDCGACTVVLEEANGERVPVNACLLALGQVHGRSIRTVEGLRDPDGAAHPVQERMAACDATQCGFCTPGIVMTAWAYSTEGGDPHEALAGNLCRCTGYRPILEAFQGLPTEATAPPPAFAVPRTVLGEEGEKFLCPGTLAELVALRAAYPEAWLLAGGTDLGLRLSEHRERPPLAISTAAVPELAVEEVRPEGMRIGAALSFRRLLALCTEEPGYGAFATLLRRLGSRQIRGVGTLGGNLGTASPIGDALPPLVALNATVRLTGPEEEREIAVEDFLTGYRSSALRPDEVIRDIWLPRPSKGTWMACEKLSRRQDQDIAALGLSVLLNVERGRIAAARIACGGLGPKVARARAAEGVLLGADFGVEGFERAAVALMEDIAPLDDLRGSAAYRRLAAGNLLRRIGLTWCGREAA